MNNKSLLLGLGIAFLLIGAIADSYYIVNQTQQAILFQFRDVVKITEKPGLHLKLPLIQSVEYFEKRVLAVDAPSQEVLLAEQKPLEVDAFARYRIVDTLLYYQRLRDERIANDRLGSLLNASLRSVLGTVKTATLLSHERIAVMAKIRDQLNKEAKDFGIEIVDVRIRRTDLPQKTSDAVFARMRSQREQEAAQLRANGQQEALQTTSEADREATVIVAEAQGKAEKLKGEGDRKALDIMAESTGKDPQFFSFWRSLMAYQETLTPSNTTYILSPDSDFFRHFGGSSTR
ncbi:MAG: protease modulator HflC [Alphaproteobacteria bacterium]|nr:protease modulator HflC [Alphaproteobacteria bacterium]